MNPLYERISDHEHNAVQSALAKRGMSITAFARQAGITRPFASRVVNGTATVSKGMAEDIGELLGIDPAHVMWPNGYGRQRER